MDLKAVRRKQLRKVIHALYENNQTAFAHVVGAAPSYINRCLSGTKNIGEKSARAWESAAKLPQWYFDDPSIDPVRGAAPSLQDEINTLPPNQRRAVEQMMRNQIRLLRGELIEEDEELLNDTRRWRQAIDEDRRRK